MMQRFDAPYMADWFAITLRWVMLIGSGGVAWAGSKTGHAGNLAPGWDDRVEPWQ
jgi:hypothetical protein